MNPTQDSHEPSPSASHAEPAEPEVRTPPWLTATGIGLFAVAGIGWLMTRPPQPTLEQLHQSQSAEQAAAPGNPAASVAQPERPAPAPKASGAERVPPALRNMPRPVPAPGKRP
ncbi:MAG: hypothetical protein HY898_09885 [Deltaproteobacteria bacterium]|nr:hypothetical protein [Deltaproteobacteria bacterium]